MENWTLIWCMKSILIESNWLWWFFVNWYSSTRHVPWQFINLTSVFSHFLFIMKAGTELIIFSVYLVSGEGSIWQWSISLGTTITSWISVSWRPSIYAPYTDLHIHCTRYERYVPGGKSLHRRSTTGFQCTKCVHFEMATKRISWGNIWFPSFALLVLHGHAANEIGDESTAGSGTHEKLCSCRAMERARGVEYTRNVDHSIQLSQRVNKRVLLLS